MVETCIALAKDLILVGTS